ncbi:MAG: hypothetical protein ACR2NM_00045 [Bythopirellula sp.]
MTAYNVLRLLVILAVHAPFGARGAPILDATDSASALLEANEREFSAGAFAIDVSPTKFPVVVNGYMNERKETKLLDPLHARCLVLDDGIDQLAIVVVDNCMMPRTLLDESKAMAQQATGIRPERILISATHTHTAPSVISVLGSGTDETYSRPAKSPRESSLLRPDLHRPVLDGPRGVMKKTSPVAAG